MKSPRFGVFAVALTLAGVIVYLHLPPKDEQLGPQNPKLNSNPQSFQNSAADVETETETDAQEKDKSQNSLLDKASNGFNWLINDDTSILDEVENENEILNNSAINMDDPRLVDIIRRKFILPPSNLPYNFNDQKLGQGDSNPSKGAVQAVAHILKTMTVDPFYIECGANDGEWGSNSIWLEKMGWTGLLIEADKITFDKLQSKHRKAHSGHFCLSNLKHPAIVNFYQDERGNSSARLGSSLIKSQQHHAMEPTPVHCFPLYSVLLAMNRTTVNFFSLDIEGSELDVLLTVPFHSVIFKVITIEKILVHQGQKALKQFMLDQGYLHFKDVNQDTIFLHPSIQT